MYVGEGLLTLPLLPPFRFTRDRPPLCATLPQPLPPLIHYHLLPRWERPTPLA